MSDTTGNTPKHLFGDPEDLLTDRAERARRQWQKEVPEVADKLLPMVLLGRLNEAGQLMSIVTIWPSLTIVSPLITVVIAVVGQQKTTAATGS